MYPQIVELALDDIVNNLDKTDFFEIEQVDPSYVRKYFGKELFQQWLSGEDFYLSEDKATELLQMSIVAHQIDDMERRGLIGTVENENGEEVVYLTEMGKKVAATGPDLDVLNRF